MSQGTRRLIRPAVIGVSAAATLAQIAPGVAFATSHPGKTAGLHPSTGAGLGERGNAKPAVDPSGCTTSSSPDYGCGKLTVQAQPVAGTFPTGATPDVSGLTFDITGPVASNDTETQGATDSCTTTADPSGDTASCPESVVGETPGGSGASTGTWVAGGQYTVALDTQGSSKAAPANSLIPPITGTFPDCTAYQSSSPSGPSGCPDTRAIKVYGTYHRVGLHVVNAVTHKGVANVTYNMCAATSGSATTGCPAGSSVVATATTGGNGKLVFSRLFLGSQTFMIVAAHEPHGYRPAHTRDLAVPAVTTAAQSAALFQPTVTLTPVTTTIKTRHLTTSKDARVSFNPFAGAKHVVTPLTLGKVGKAKHGKVRHSGGHITYKPHNGFVGNDVFHYTVRNGVGAKTTVKVVVRVTD